MRRVEKIPLLDTFINYFVLIHLHGIGQGMWKKNLVTESCPTLLMNMGVHACRMFGRSGKVYTDTNVHRIMHARPWPMVGNLIERITYTCFSYKLYIKLYIQLYRALTSPTFSCRERGLYIQLVHVYELNLYQSNLSF